MYGTRLHAKGVRPFYSGQFSPGPRPLPSPGPVPVPVPSPGPCPPVPAPPPDGPPPPVPWPPPWPCPPPCPPPPCPPPRATSNKVGWGDSRVICWPSWPLLKIAASAARGATDIPRATHNAPHNNDFFMASSDSGYRIERKAIQRAFLKNADQRRKSDPHFLRGANFLAVSS